MRTLFLRCSYFFVLVSEGVGIALKFLFTIISFCCKSAKKQQPQHSEVLRLL